MNIGDKSDHFKIETRPKVIQVDNFHSTVAPSEIRADQRQKRNNWSLSSVNKRPSSRSVLYSLVPLLEVDRSLVT